MVCCYVSLLLLLINADAHSSPVNSTETGTVNSTETGTVNSTETGTVKSTETGTVNSTETGTVNSTETVNKRGSCPESRGFGICAELCSSDVDCSGNQKCCFNGCGHVCHDPVHMEPQNPCDFGSPLSLIFCGRGPTHQDCPKGYSCKIDPVDAYAVCCPEDLCPEDDNTCFIDPCDVITCPKFPDALCVPTYCGCYASFFVGKNNVTNICETDDELCPDGSSPVNCLVDPCKVAKCAKYPYARCVSSYCGGCNANFFVKKRNVTKRC